MSVHLTLRGEWRTCTATERACPRLIHLANMSPRQARELPFEMLEPLIEIVDPPVWLRGGGAKPPRREWGALKPGPGNQVVLHRDHDLPAVIVPGEKQEWWQHGRLHRDGDRPAVVWDDGGLEWWHAGGRHRDDGKPAVVTEESMEWYEHNAYHREQGPAYVSLWQVGKGMMLPYTRGVAGPAIMDTNAILHWQAEARRYLP